MMSKVYLRQLLQLLPLSSVFIEKLNNKKKIQSKSCSPSFCEAEENVIEQKQTT